MLYNRCTGIYKFGNNNYPRRIKCRSNLGHIFREKIASYGPGNMVISKLTATEKIFRPWDNTKMAVKTEVDLNYSRGRNMVCTTPIKLYII